MIRAPACPCPAFHLRVTAGHRQACASRNTRCRPGLSLLQLHRLLPRRPGSSYPSERRQAPGWVAKPRAVTHLSPLMSGCTSRLLAVPAAAPPRLAIRACCCCCRYTLGIDPVGLAPAGGFPPPLLPHTHHKHSNAFQRRFPPAPTRAPCGSGGRADARLPCCWDTAWAGGCRRCCRCSWSGRRCSSRG